MPLEGSTVTGEQTVEALRHELAEAREQQAATAEILASISSSVTDANQVFAKIAASAARLCDAHDATIFQVRGDSLRVVAHHGPIPPGGTLPLTRATMTGSVVLDRRAIHVADLQVETDKYPESSVLARLLGFNTILTVPLIHAGEAIGAIGIRRTEVRPFTDRQIGLLRTFADQAVIAIENTRLFNTEQASKRELRESLEYQTATSEVLNVISRSPNELQPVFDVIAQSASRLCGDEYAIVARYDGELLHLVAQHNPRPDSASETERWFPHPPVAPSVLAPAIKDNAVVHISDIEDEELSQSALKAFRRISLRAVVAVPMIHESRTIGTIAVSRAVPGAFPQRQIDLLRTFADQAVIAIENTRLFEEVQARTRDLTVSLEQQTATSEILSIISTSPGDLEPVFQTMLANATRLCEANFGVLFRYDGHLFHAAALQEVEPEFAEHLRHNPPRPDPRNAVHRLLQTKQPIHIADVAAEPVYAEGEPSRVALVEIAGARTYFIVPMLKEDELIGAIAIYRREVRSFTDRQVQLVAGFASQAVIAIENVRLLNELRESLQQQTATADVLKAISRSAFDLQPVLDTLVESAAKLCEADQGGMVRKQGSTYITVANYGHSLQSTRFLRASPFDVGRDTITGRVIHEGRAIQVGDVLEDPELDASRYKVVGSRTILGVPLLREGAPIGVFVLSRRAVRPFTDKQIELVSTFADQAVIAIENTRLFEELEARTKELQARTRELTESLEYQTATGEVLNIISRSPSELQHVLDAIVATAIKLCDGFDASIFLKEGDQLRVGAHHGGISLGVGSMALGRGWATGRAVMDHAAVHVCDFALMCEEFPEGYQQSMRDGVRTGLAVPLLREGDAIGAFMIRRKEVRPFSDKQIELLKTFADQAVIAIENSRLFEAEQASKRELARSVEELESLGKVSQAVNSSLELDKVLPTILEHACAMSYAGVGTVYVFDKTTSVFRLAAAHNMSDEHIAMVRAQPMRLNSAVVGECAMRREVVQVADLSSAAPSPLLDILLRTGVRAVLAVPLLHQAEVVGVLVVRRNQPGTFSPEVIRLVEAFATQSAIAVENARLFGEIAQKSRELEIASQHKSQFVANMSHELRTPLAAILGYAELMQEGFYEPQGPKSLDALTRIRSNGKHLLGLINTVLDIAKIESGQFTLNMAEYAIESLVETVRSATESLAQNKRLALKTEVAKSLPIGLGDEQRLTQVLLNLVGNAIKFTDAGEVRVTAKAVNGHFNVSVTDTGPGIPDHERTCIFEQFHQVDSSLTKAAGGTGLGLAIAKQIVEMHGGRIWVESTVGKGSTFQMEIPTRAEFRKRGL